MLFERPNTSLHSLPHAPLTKKQNLFSHARLAPLHFTLARGDRLCSCMRRSTASPTRYGARLPASRGGAVVGPATHAAACKSWTHGARLSALLGAARGRCLPALARGRCLPVLSRSHRRVVAYKHRQAARIYSPANG
jgi:hypothetical protein